MIAMLMGTPYKFSTRGWKQFLRKWKETGEMPDIDCFATRMTRGAVPNITDWDVSEASYALEELNNG